MTDESGCWAVRTYNVMMTDGGGRGDRGYAINCDCSDSYDMYVVTITGEKLIPMTDTYKSFTDYIVDCVIGNKQEWYYWGSNMADSIYFG